MFFRRDEPAWEVVDSKSVEPIAMYNDSDIVITALSPTILTYTLPITLGRTPPSILLSLQHARALLLRAAARRAFNILLTEGWTITLLRRPGPRPVYQMEVKYSGRPARAEGEIGRGDVPFLAMAERWEALGKAYVKGHGGFDEEEHVGRERAGTVTTQASGTTAENGDAREKGCERRLSRVGRAGNLKRRGGFLGRFRGSIQ